MSKEYVDISIKIIIIGLIVGIVASLWTILPFFISGIFNVFYMTISIGLVLLLFLTDFRKDKIIKSGVLAILTFFLVSYLIIPTISGLLINNEIDTSLSNNKDLATLNIKLPGLFCQGCAYSSQNALKGINGVVDAKVDFGTKSGIVIYDPNLVTPEIILGNDVIRAYQGYIE